MSSGDTNRRNPDRSPLSDASPLTVGVAGNGATGNGHAAHVQPPVPGVALPVGALDGARPVSPSLCEALAAGRLRGVLSFAGQAVEPMAELAALLDESGAVVRPWLERAADALVECCAERSARLSGLYGHGLDLRRWLQDPDSRPDAAVLASSPVSMVLIFVAQVARLLAALDEGLDAALARGHVVAATGHSQGLIAALFAAESGARPDLDRAVEYLRYTFLQGLHMEQSWRGSLEHGAESAQGSPMVAVSGPDETRLRALLDAVNRGLPPAQRIEIALYNTRTRHVVSGAPTTLSRLQQRLEATRTRELERRKRGQHGGAVLEFTWEPLPVSAAFHSPHMAPGLETIRAEVARSGFSIAPQALQLQVISSADGTALHELPDADALTDALLVAQFTAPVRWQATLLELERFVEPERGLLVVDLGPGDGVAKLAAAALRGTGVDLVALGSVEGRREFFAPGSFAARPRPRSWRAFEPALARLPDGRLVLDNRYTRATGQSPVVLPGMTPTTVDVPIVAAAANAGFTAELAGGGQVSERIFALRMEELSEALAPGCGVVFNALYLDRYLWDLHLGQKALVQRARKAGAPLCGVTISAGLPEVDEAVALLDQLAALGMTHNAFKPGTAAQVDRVIAIARAARHHTIFVHLEGGRAGGHHSWEDLDELLLATWHKVRAEPNLVLCVGGGIADEARATALLTGQWARAHGLPPMPVDAVLLGTLAMACAEATTSPAVKQALVEAQGTEHWVYAGQAEGQVTSGRSQLDADIHYIDNAAARCGRLLDEVAGNPEAIAARRDEIIAALAQTAKPWFGDLDTMTWRAVLERAVALFATGRHGRYEDGVFVDRSWRQRLFELMRRAEARLMGREVASGRGGEPSADEAAHDAQGRSSVIPDPAALDAPHEVLARLCERFPESATRRLHPADVQWFVRELCARPGKPVPFVPVIDADVRRWYKSDSLWQAHDERLDADAVLIIPGPQAVAGIRRADEPVAELLGRFEQAAVAELARQGAPVRELAWRAQPAAPVPLPVGIEAERSADRVSLRVIDAPQQDPTTWLDHVASLHDGPVAALASAAALVDGQDNPLRRVAVAEAGARLELLTQGRTLESLTWRLGAERLEVRRVDARRVVYALQLGAAPGSEHLPPPYRLELELRDAVAARPVFTLDAGAGASALARFFRGVILDGEGSLVEPTARGLFAPVEREVVVDAELARAYATHTGQRSGTAHNYAFSLVWPALFEVLGGDDELAAGMLRLVHLENRVVCEAGWPVRAGERLLATARLVRVEDSERGRVVRTECVLRRAEGGEPCARVESGFFVRGSHADSPFEVRARERLEAVVRLRDAAALDFLRRHRDLIELSEEGLVVGERLRLVAELSETRERNAPARYGASGELRLGERVVGRVVAGERESTARVHPLRALLEALADDVEAAPAVQPTPPRTLLVREDRAPASMDVFAEVGGDRNPIHRSLAVARLAGLERPIVHGMWTAARLSALVGEHFSAARVREVRAEFLGTVEPGERLRLTVRRVGVVQGALVVEALAEVVRTDGADQPAVRLTARIAPPRTAYVLPGQGIQQRGMGMDGYARSRAAREVWERADAYSRRALGFSILRIVRDNPRELVIDGVPQVHPAGVLNLTQFTQVAMAVLARAQVAELREAGVFVEDAITCGHSVGEYNALSAVADVLDVEDVVDLVYQRGLAMHRLVARDEHGQSGYGMGVIRPHYAGMSHAEAEALVAQVRQASGEHLEIVNYNVRGRQYSVTGRTAALAALAAELERRQLPGGKAAFLEVPGIDVPFHSSVLRDGVAAFRKTLEARLPAEIDPARLTGRYIPNLVPRAFTLDRAFIEEIHALTGSQPLAAVLADYAAAAARPARLCRTLLIELLAWQFASPVRWIETQDLMLAPRSQGGLGVERIVEVGVGYQPTLANMARQTLAATRLEGIEIVNVEAEREQVFALDEDAPEAISEPAPAADAPAAPAAPIPAAPVAAADAPAAPAAPIPAAPVAAVAAAGPVQDLPFTAADALRSLLALQARVRPEQIAPTETIDELFEGVSSRRNQVLLDLGAEFNVGAIDGAHEKPIARLAEELATRARSYQAPGRYLRAAQDEAIKRVFARAGLNRAALAEQLSTAWGLPDGLQAAVFDAIALATRDGASTRGGALGEHAGAVPASKTEAHALLDGLVQGIARARGITLAPRNAGTGAAGAAVDAAVVRELEDRILGPDGVLLQATRDLAERLGVEHAPQPPPQPELDPAAAVLDAELGRDYAQLVAPAFDPLRHVALTSAWAFARRDVARLYFDAANHRLDDRALLAEVDRLAVHGTDPQVAATARWYAGRARNRGAHALATALERIASGERLPVAVQPSRPRVTVSPLDGSLGYQEVPDPAPQALRALIAELFSERRLVEVAPAAVTPIYRGVLETSCVRPLAMGGSTRGAARTALVTGASPGSIAVEAVAHLLRGGARVIVTTSSLSPERLAFYRALYQRHAVDGAELHVVPFNQASRQDVERLCDWLFDEISEQAGAVTRVIKRPWSVDLVLPFAAMKDLATLGELEGRSEAALRALLLGVEWLVAGLATRHLRRGFARAPLHVVLPLSPNHGAFGGDGTYAEGKAALEVLLAKWHSEQDAWARAVTLVGAKIGWVRGTGLMDANNLVAPGLERRCGIRTFSSAEMGLLIAGLCAEEIREAARRGPLEADLSGGFHRMGDVRAAVAAVRDALEADGQYARRLRELEAREREALGLVEAAPAPVVPLPEWPLPLAPAPVADLDWPAPQGASLHDTVVIVGLGELGPCGSARTRFELELDDPFVHGEGLSAAGVLELAWTTGLVRYETDDRGGRWLDAESGEPVAEHELVERYEAAVRERVGVRFIDPSVAGFDAERMPVLTTAYLERDFTFEVGSEAEAREFAVADPEHTRVRYDAERDAWFVTRKAGTEVRVPRRVAMSRRVAGQLPTGFDPARYGIPRDMIESVDPLALYNLIATVDAFLSAGLTPEALLAAVHPARVANTQGAGMGGMQSLRRMYVDHLLGAERQSDILQESLINVVAAYVVQSYVGSYGPMSHPVAACATAAISLEEGLDKILAGKADFVVAGAFDDLCAEGMIGFGDMNATAETDAMLARGIAPAGMSRANDVRRRGFVEAQGGGTALLCRASVALELGLPVYGVLAQALSFGDGVHKSIPAPGRGLLAAAMGGRSSPLGQALTRHGLTADDIALVYKHDTSTGANDPNENELHDEIQRALGRTPGNPLFVVSQKTLTGHSKGGAAAWQLGGLCQSMLHGVVAGNRNLESVDPAMRAFAHMAFTDRPLRPGQAEPLRAGLLTSLGFGHVSSIALVLHRDAFHALIPVAARAAYFEKVAQRIEAQTRQHAEALMGVRPFFERRSERRFEAADGTAAQALQERALLLDPSARLDAARGLYRSGSHTSDERPV